MADMDKLEQRRTLQSLILFFKCFKLDGPNYVSLFTPRLTKYNLQDNGLDVVQPPYNRGTQRGYSSKPLNIAWVERILVFKR